MTPLNSVATLLNRGKSILILPHIHPDGDTIGSSLALLLALRRIGKEAFVLVEDEIPSNLNFLPLEDIHSKLPVGICPDVVVSIDASDLDRLGSRADYLKNAAVTINLDHHITNLRFAQYNYIDVQAAATGEIVFELIKAMQIDMDKEMATCIYCALSTDTGSFKYDNTTARTHQIASGLLEHALDLNEITVALYQNKAYGKIKLLGEALNSLQLHYDGKLSILSVTKCMLEKSKADHTDADGLIEFARDIEGVAVAVLLKELSHNEIKVGFRAKYDVDVAKVAAKFGGGGHKKASGCTIYSNIAEARIQIMDAFKFLER
ncbi:DHH family phosphoesterase [Geosporobacter ferrireducens]|uniref:Phosphoesterase n=1 Tax=Geosporobacter ferrireducens TaxID=1424294 RepID=A0A1D8GBH7_9FIRM|nr:bifunctional oligoribonuclease/PAP phosphatase NrnA [Geosporobacter ferrireducens]AOT68233.1 hypothetical protein Gferi_00710 [Geosporobacter ferrireducens]MTI57348.1 bifunctional oligoribonuclease/PAP phosphatase NrnA [Geosporobacter ferrireducens]